RTLDILHSMVHRKDNHFCMFTELADVSGRLDTVHHGHGDIHHNYIWAMQSSLFYYLLPVRCHGDDLDIPGGFEQKPQAIAQDSMIIRQDDCDHWLFSFSAGKGSLVSMGIFTST